MTITQEEFKYVIQKQEKQKICFGSGCARDTSKKNMSPFMRYYTLEDHPNVAPNSYDVLKSFKSIITKPCPHSISKKGYSGIARFARKKELRDHYQSPLHYNVSTFPKIIHKSKYPFDSNSKRQTFISNTIPGPGMYISIKRKEPMLEHSFGGRVKMKLGVNLKCCSRNTDICKICGKKPIGDYWHLQNEIFLCRSCMSKKYEKETSSNRRKLEKFQKIRDCSIMHQHDTTTAKIWLMHPKGAVQWIRKETYLSTYFNE
ncbi:hypothetical protein E2986_02913 [Frieseomelitta varia]|uniref:Uncharacterized protein n=1 Tax=Frieseomelitta varia TaxID=561572 RepID=A0A833W029_9HYME|nr:uncharacterized protein LOC122526992 isoform X1 [Frieseomelitta varia]KAF3419952.1 hypothetical protein E2986_02913 [Frieseomelitta varia]